MQATKEVWSVNNVVDMKASEADYTLRRSDPSTSDKFGFTSPRSPLHREIGMQRSVCKIPRHSARLDPNGLQALQKRLRGVDS